MQQEPLVMLVEDDEGTRDGYAEFLERGGFRVAQAASAEDALSQCGTQVPDVVVTDIALPGRDGFALAAELKHQLPTRGVPIVAMTAYWATDVHDRAGRAGIAAILRKPCQPEHLIAELQRVLADRLQLPPASTGRARTSRPKSLH